MKSNRTLAIVSAALIGISVLVGANPAVADDTDEAGIVNDFALDPGQTIVYQEGEIEGLRESDAADQQLSDAQVDEARADYVQESRDSGVFVDPNTVDVVPLLDGNASITLEQDQIVESATFAVSNEGVLSVSAQTTDRAPDNVTFSGPGMEASWDNNGSGSYTIKIYVDFKLDGRGELLYASGFFSWRRYKLINDGDPDNVFYRYQRYGDFQPESISFAEDARAQRLRIQSFPLDGIESDLKDWKRFSPGADRHDTCDSYSASVSFKNISVSAPFNERCGVYNMWRNIDKPSSYWIQYQNPNGGSGNREVAYVLIWSQKPGTEGSMHDLQLIETMIGECQQTDASRTCHW